MCANVARSGSPLIISVAWGESSTFLLKEHYEYVSFWRDGESLGHEIGHPVAVRVLFAGDIMISFRPDQGDP